MKTGGYVYRVLAFNKLFYVCEQQKYELDDLVKFEVKYKGKSEYTYIRGSVYEKEVTDG